MRRLHGICMAGLMTDFASCRESATLPRAKPAMPTDQVRGVCNTNVIGYECLQCMLVADATQLHQLLPKTQVCYGMEPQNGPCCIDGTLDASHCSAPACLCLTLGRRGGASSGLGSELGLQARPAVHSLHSTLLKTDRLLAHHAIKTTKPWCISKRREGPCLPQPGWDEVMVIRMLGVAGRASLTPYNDQQQH